MRICVGRRFTRTKAGLAGLALAMFGAAVALCRGDRDAPPPIDLAARQAALERLAREAKPGSRSPHASGKVHFDLLAKLLADDRRSAPTSACLAQLDQDQPAFRAPTQAHTLLGQPAPDFTLLDHEGRAWRLADRSAAGPVAIVFYLGYGCDACVHHLFELDADLAKFRALGAEVVAISGDSAAVTRERFDRYGAFGFPVLSDPEHRVAEMYGVEADGAAADATATARSHATFLVRQGLVRKGGVVCWANVSSTPFRGTMALLYELRQGNKQASSIEQALPIEARATASAEQTSQP